MRMYVGGEWLEGARTEDVINPWDGTAIDTVPVAAAHDVEQALQAAVRGAQRQRTTPAADRQAILNRAADLADQRVDELARTISLESGKLLTEAAGEASRAGDMLRLAAFEGAQLFGDSLPLDAHRGAGQGRLGFTVRQPCGVVVAITPFNYPSLLVLHKIAPALAAGNSVILKPARKTPLTSLLLTRILLDAGLDPDAISCITGPGDELGPLLCGDPRVRKISFTGNSATGAAITRIAGVKRLSLELGASCPVIVLEDADLELAARAVSIGGYVNAGQVCISVQRVLVDEAVAGDFLDALTPLVRAIRTGNPLAAETTMGVLVSESEAERVERAIEASVAAGATLLCGGERAGTMLAPAVVASVDPTSPLSQDELFGPAVAVSSAGGVEEAIRLANASPYGLGAGIFTRDVGRALQFVRDVDAGNLHVNWTPLWRADLMPYGGLKASGIGKEGPRWAVEEMTETKTVIFHGT
ncbi:MAG: aldehyde dehydrogenase family protein [Chloroflexi bacterium]|nr:aldehyde dehydrogenase family protein [Chloroflexota bacterium]